jgi:hypothetical protein
MEGKVNITIRLREQALLPELWMSSALSRFTYPLMLTGLDDKGN